MTIEIALPNQEEIILKHLLDHHSASMYELQELGVKNPSRVISTLVEDKEIPIRRYRVKTHRIEENIVYSHYRYFIDKTGIWRGAE